MNPHPHTHPHTHTTHTYNIATQAVLSLGYSQRFWLKYQFYFAYCEAAFDAK